MSEPRDILENAIVVGPNMGPTEAEPAPSETPPAADPADAPDPAALPEEPAPGEDAPAADEDEETTQDAPAPRHRNGIQERLSQLAAQRRAAQEEANYWKQRALEQAPPPQARPTTQTSEGGRPLPEQFQTHDAYQEALIDWRVNQRLAHAEQQQMQRSALQQARTQYEDFDSVVGASQIQLNPDVVQSLLASEHLHPLRYYLATHADEAALLNQLNGRQADRAIGFLEGKILASQASGRTANGSAEPTPPRTTQAPPPIAPTRASATRVPRGYDELSLNEFMKQRNKEERESRL